MEESTVVREQNENKRRKLKSKVWDAFTKTEPSVEEGKRWAILATCNYCGAEFDGYSKKGTTHLKNHLRSKKCRDKRNGGNGDKSIKTRDKSTTPVVMKEKSSVIDLIKQIYHEYEGFTMHKKLSAVANSREDEILQVYQEEKEKLGKFLSKLSCRFSLFIYRGDSVLWEVFVLMVQYIDDSWERQSKIINILPGAYASRIKETTELFLELKIDRNICCIILNDDCLMLENYRREVIKSWFSQLPFAGFALDFEGFLDTIYHLTLGWGMIEIEEMRECVDYIYNNASSSLLQRPVYNVGKNFNFNDNHCGRIWRYANLECLEVVVGLKEVFSELQKIDPNFRSINLTNQQWDKAIVTLQHLKALREFYESFHWDKSNSFATTVVDFLKLFGFHRSEACILCEDAKYKQLFDSIQVYSIIAILDPRFKMDPIKFWYEGIYDSDDDGYFEKIIKYFRDIYNEYAKDSNDDYKMMDAMGRPSTSSTKSEFDLYLHDLKVPAVQEFDILAWWRRNDLFYPTLARMARDYLAMAFQPIDIDSTLEDETKWFSDSQKWIMILRALP